MIYIILAMLIYSVAILFATAASRHADTNLVAAISNTMAAFIPLAITIPFLTKKAIHNQKFGIIMALIAGILIAFFVMAINKAYSLNKVGIVAPVVWWFNIFVHSSELLDF